MTHHEQDDMTVRVIPTARWPAIGWLVLVLVVAATAAWEWKMRSLGLRAGDLDDGARRTGPPSAASSPPATTTAS